MNTTQQDSHGGDELKIRYAQYLENSGDVLIRYTDGSEIRLSDYVEQLATQRVHEARLNELKHRANDIIGRMYRLDRKYADNYLLELTAELKGHAK